MPGEARVCVCVRCVCWCPRATKNRTVKPLIKITHHNGQTKPLFELNTQLFSFAPAQLKATYCHFSSISNHILIFTVRNIVQITHIVAEILIFPLYFSAQCNEVVLCKMYFQSCTTSLHKIAANKLRFTIVWRTPKMCSHHYEHETIKTIAVVP